MKAPEQPQGVGLGISPIKPFEFESKPPMAPRPPLPNQNALQPSKHPNPGRIRCDERGLHYNNEPKVLADRNNVSHSHDRPQDKPQDKLQDKKPLNLSHTQAGSQNYLDPHITMTTRDRMKRLEASGSKETLNLNVRAENLPPGLRLFQNPRIQRQLVPHGSSQFNDAASARSGRSTTSSITKGFSARGLAQRIKQHTLRLLQTFDRNSNHTVDREEVEAILVGLLKENALEIKYVTKNYFRYSERTKEVTFEMFTEFFLGLHCGEMAVQRFHGSGRFSRSRELLMNRDEFIMSFQGALDYIEFLAPTAELKHLFREIDADRDGWISYKEYFEFLKHFFSYLPACTKQALSNNPSLAGTPLTSPRGDAEPEPEDLVSALIRNQTVAVLSRYRGSGFGAEEVRRVLREVFGALASEVPHVVAAMPQYGAGALSLDSALSLLMDKWCGEAVLNRLHEQGKFMRHQERLLGNNDFLILLDTAFEYLSSRPRREDLIALFKSLDTDRDGYISYRKYLEFVREHLGSYKQEARRDDESERASDVDDLEPLSLSGVRSENGDRPQEPRARVPSGTAFLKV